MRGRDVFAVVVIISVCGFGCENQAPPSLEKGKIMIVAVSINIREDNGGSNFIAGYDKRVNDVSSCSRLVSMKYEIWNYFPGKLPHYKANSFTIRRVPRQRLYEILRCCGESLGKRVTNFMLCAFLFCL